MERKELFRRMDYYRDHPTELAENKKYIRKQVSRCLTEHGFKKRRATLFYQIRGDLAAFFCLEHPPGGLYVNCCIYPLYLPPLEYLNLNLGNRMEQILLGLHMRFSDCETPEEVELWCRRMDAYITNRLEPFLSQVDTADHMVQYIQRRDRWKTVGFHIGPGDEYEMLMYAHLMLHRYPEAIAAAKAHLGQFTPSRYTEAVIDAARGRFREVTEMADSRDDEATDAFFRLRRQENIAFFTGPKKPSA